MRRLGLRATEISRKITASSEVVYHLLVRKGLLGGGPGAYFVTEAGKAFGVERSVTKNNPFDTFEFANWSESVIAELGATAE